MGHVWTRQTIDRQVLSKTQFPDVMAVAGNRLLRLWSVVLCAKWYLQGASPCCEGGLLTGDSGLGDGLQESSRADVEHDALGGGVPVDGVLLLVSLATFRAAAGLFRGPLFARPSA